MAGAQRRGYGEDGIYFDHQADCRDSAHHRTCAGRWRGVVSLGFSADGKRLRKKVSGSTKAEVREKLKELHAELDAGVRTVAGYTVAHAVDDWLADGLPGRVAKTVEVNRDSLQPLLAVIGTIQQAHNFLTRVIRHAEGQDLVRRNGHGPDLPPEAGPGNSRGYRRIIGPLEGGGPREFPSHPRDTSISGNAVPASVMVSAAWPLAISSSAER